MTAISGRVVIAASVPPFTAGVVHVRLEDVSNADARASLIAEAVIPDVSHDPATHEGPTVVMFRLTAPDVLAADRDFSVRVWVDCDGDGRPSSRDVWSDQAYRVLTRGFGTDVTVTVGM